MEKISKEIIASEHKGIIMTRLIQSFVHDPLLIISTEEIFLRDFITNSLKNMFNMHFICVFMS